MTQQSIAPAPWHSIGGLGTPGRTFAWAPLRDWDGGAPLTAQYLGEARDGGVLAIASMAGRPLPYAFDVQPIAGRLHLALYADEVLAGVCPVCAIRRFAARYVCAPP